MKNNQLTSARNAIGRLIPITSLLLLFTLSAMAQDAPTILFPGLRDNSGSLKGDKYYRYLADLAPKLRSYGIDAVWVSPLLEQEKNPVSRPAHEGSSNEYQKMVAALRANGIGVIYDLSNLSAFERKDLATDTVTPTRKDANDLSLTLQMVNRTKSASTSERLSFGHDDFLSL